MKKSNKKIVFNKFIENPVMNAKITDAWYMKAFFKTAEEAGRAVIIRQRRSYVVQTVQQGA